MRSTFLPFGKPSYDKREAEAVARVLDSGWSGPGKEVDLFEQEMAEYLGVRNVVAVSSCTAALQLCLMLLGDSYWYVPALTWCSTAENVKKPVLLDVDRDTMWLPSQSNPAIRVAFGGLMVEGYSFLLDAAHAFSPLAAHNSFLTCYSFYGNKNLAIGEGGAISTNNDSAAVELRKMRQHGYKSNAWSRYFNTHGPKLETTKGPGIKATMSNVQAAIGRVQLQKLPEMQARRQEIAEHYIDNLPSIHPWINWQAGLGTPYHSHHLFVIVLPEDINRDAVFQEMRDRNIGVALHYVPLYRLGYPGDPKDFPNTEYLYNHMMTLPISASMTYRDARDVMDALYETLS